MNTKNSLGSKFIGTVNGAITCLRKGLSFEVKLPNDKTLAAIEELESRKGSKYNSMKELWSDLKGD